MTTWRDVLDGRARWSCEAADAVAWLRELPDDSIDLLVTSPPYEQARTYGLDTMVGGEAWVSWMVDIIAVASTKVRGLIAVNCEGQTRDYSYSGVPFLLFADLKRAGFTMRKPVVYHRVGIPGNGGNKSQHADAGGSADWLRNDWEPVICVSRPGKLPWADALACGRKPLMKSGPRVTHRNANGSRDYNGYKEPEIANPGNIIRVPGGHTGSAHAHSGEAPFHIDLPAFFVKSFCPPDGVVCDPFSGSGTTAHAAFENGRRFVGCDLRQNQVDLCARRLATVTPDLFAGASA